MELNVQSRQGDHSKIDASIQEGRLFKRATLLHVDGADRTELSIHIIISDLELVRFHI
jgi:hypothetical protein